MEEIQRFALKNIYCSSAQDRQYRFKLVRLTKPNFPVKAVTTVYGDQRRLPNSTSRFHVYVVGNIPNDVLNLLRKDRNWFKDVWYKVSDDMNSRGFIFQLYDATGLNFPRDRVYYSSGWDGGLVIAVETDTVVNGFFKVDDVKYIRLYSNQYFNTAEFSEIDNGPNIYCKSYVVYSNADKVAIQTAIAGLESNGGKTLVYVNGYFTETMSLHVPNGSLVEIVYDRSIIGSETYSISDLRTFESTKDNKLKYLLFRPRVTDYIQYEDDLEVYVTANTGNTTKGLYYYQHKDYALCNVTDKDYSLYTQYVNSQAQVLSDLVGGGLSDKRITVLTRTSGMNRKLVYSSLKLHELYNLPDNTELDVISNTGFTIPELRAEQLEDSYYFKVASASGVREVSKEISTEAVGYNGVSYYFGNTPNKVTGTSVDVPFLYRKGSIAYEYSAAGKLIKYIESTGPIHLPSSLCKYVEFIQGNLSNNQTTLYDVNEAIPLLVGEYVVLVAQYSMYSRISTWLDVTDSPDTVYENNTVTVNDLPGKRVRVMYLDEAFVKDLTLPLVDGILMFPVTTWEDRGTGFQFHNLDLPYDSVEVFLNGYRLTYEVDFLIDFPYINIFNKSYLDTTADAEQSIHVRMTGYNLDKTKINDNEIRGFVNNGALTRNNYYDIREDKVFSVFIDGKLTDNDGLVFSEKDNTVRLGSPINGLPYTMSEKMLSIREVTGLPTLPYYYANKEVNLKVADLYNKTYPEPTINEFNVITTKHYIYSTVICKIIYDLLDGNIPPSLYTTPYNDTTVQDLLNNTYKRELLLDPIKLDLPPGIVEILPHTSVSVISLNLFQYRFLTNVVRIVTQGKPSLINLTDHITINTETVDVNSAPLTPGGIVTI